MSRLSLELRWWIGLLLALQILTSSAGIGLLARVSPAVDQILRENEYSVEAVEDMLALLASEPGLVSEAGRARFVEAATRAKNNVTEEGEGTLVGRIEALSGGALSGDARARAELIATLRELSSINRKSMMRADLEAQRLGGGGAWAAALAGFVGFLLGVWVLRRLLDRLIVPVLQIDATLEGARKGDPQRRCAPLTGPAEIGRLRENVNWLLDERHRSGQTSDSSAAILRAALLLHIDASPKPVIVVDKQSIIAMNQAAYAHAGESDAIAKLSAALRDGNSPPAGWSVERLGEEGWICRLLA